MAIRIIEDSSNDLPVVPWLNEWNKAKSNDGNGYNVLALLVTDKGIILATSEFKVMVWKSQSLHNQILEHVGTAYDGTTSNDALVLVVKTKLKAMYQAGFDDSEKGYWTSVGKIYTFLPATHPPSEALIPDVMSGVAIDSSPKTGRRAS